MAAARNQGAGMRIQREFNATFTRSGRQSPYDWQAVPAESRKGEKMSIARAKGSRAVSIVDVQGPLRVPVNQALRHEVRAALRRGERRILLNLARVSRIDAAGVGQLVRAYNMTSAANGVLRIVHATPWVRDILDRVGLFDLLSAPLESDFKESA